MRPDRPSPSRVSVGGILWSRVIRRHWVREPWLTGTLVAILALGVAVFLAVRLANKAAVSGFGLFTESVSGESDLILRPPSGWLPVEILRELRGVSGPLPVDFFPVLEISGVVEGEEEQGLLRLVGVDLVAVGNALGQSGIEAETGVFSREDDREGDFGSPDAVHVGTAFAEARGLNRGDRLRLWIGERAAEVRLANLLPDPANRPAIPGNFVLVDLPALQALSGKTGRLSRVEIRFPEGADGRRIRAEASARLQGFSEERGLHLETPEDRKASVTRMSAAFRMNLAILSGLALLVGVYLIMQAMEAAVTKRRAEIAILRSLGVTPGRIRRTWLLEALVFGGVGGVAGVLLGRVLASGLVGAVATTVNTLYYETTTRAVSMHPGEAAFSFLFGIAASLAAAWIPARDAAATPPAQALKQGELGGGLVLLRRWPIGFILVAAGFALTWLPPLGLTGGTAFPLGGYLSALVIVLGASILLGLLFRPIARILSSWDGPMRRYAASRLAAAGGRHRLTAAGLSAAIGMSAAMAILVASFETTLTAWIAQILKADLYVAAPGASSTANGNRIAEADWRRLLAFPEVAGAEALQRQSVEFEGREVQLGGVGYHGDAGRFLELLWIDPPAQSGPDTLEDGDAWISEPFARRFRKGRGNSIEIPTPAGLHRLEIAGVYADYGNEAGAVLVSGRQLARWYGDDSVSNLALYLSPGADPENLLERIRSEFPSLVSRTNERLRAESIRVFHQTFAVTYALEAIAVIIAVGGLGLALAGLLLERKGELATLRSLGATRRDIARAAMWEGTGIALAGLAGGIVSSFLLGWILIDVINPQSFGWTLRYAVPWSTLAGLSGATLATAMLVAWIVGYRNANLRSDREE